MLVAIQCKICSIRWDTEMQLFTLMERLNITLTVVRCWLAWRKSGNFITPLGNETKVTFASKFKSHLTFHNSMSTTIIKWSCNKTSSILIYLLPFSARAWHTNLEKCFSYLAWDICLLTLQPFDTYWILYIYIELVLSIYYKDVCQIMMYIWIICLVDTAMTI